MSFSVLVRDHFQDKPERAEAWEKVFLELQVVLAYCDGVLAPAERMTLSLLSLAKRDERENRRMVDQLIRTIETNGLEDAAQQVVQDITKLLAEEAKDKRPTLASEILRESVAIVVADDVISPKERAFVSERLAPSLTVAPQEAQALLKKASGRLSRSRAYVERAFEIFMMIADLEERPPQLNTAEGDELPGFLGAVDRFVIEQRAASSRVVAYFLGAVGGIFWVEEYEHHIAELGELAQAARNLRAKSGVEARLHTIQHELGQLRNRGVDPNGFRAVARHVTNVLGKMQGLTDAQRALFRDHIASALELDYGTLLKTSAQRRSMIDLHNNLVGRAQAEEPESQRWWQFWK